MFQAKMFWHNYGGIHFSHVLRHFCSTTGYWCNGALTSMNWTVKCISSMKCESQV